jgi:transcriptional regulator with XRE-family HTH domain
MPILEELKAAIRDSGQTLTYISQKTGVPVSSLSRFLSGERDIGVTSADAIAKYFGLTLKPDKKRKKPPGGVR